MIQYIKVTVKAILKLLCFTVNVKDKNLSNVNWGDKGTQKHKYICTYIF